MLQRRSHSSGVVFYASPLLENIGVRHAFSTRIGGVSPVPFDSLNLGNPSGCELQDDTVRIHHNYDLLQEAMGCPTHRRHWLHQVHAGTVLDADAPGFENSQKADALFSRDAGKTLSIRTADCIPILLADISGKHVAAIHAGWRGIIANVIGHTLAKFADSANIIAGIGPCIGVDAFEVGPEVLAHFRDAFGAQAPIRGNHVDLRSAARLQLLAAGVPDGQIDSTDRCTVGHVAEFFSHRRDAGVTGRMANLIAARA